MVRLLRSIKRILNEAWRIARVGGAIVVGRLHGKTEHAKLAAPSIS
jgi:hypothetical protein